MSSPMIHRMVTMSLACSTVCFGTILVFAEEVNWVLEGNGDWSVAENWSSVPNSPQTEDDVTIDIPGRLLTVTHTQGEHVIKSLATDEVVSISGGSLRVTEGLSLDTGGISVTSPNVSFNHDGPTSIADASLRADNGGVLALPQATAYVSNSNFDGTLFISAIGLNSLVDLPNLSVLEGNKNFRDTLRVEAIDGGRINLPAVEQITEGDMSFTVQGLGSRIDATSLQRVVSPGRTFSIRNGGEFVAPALESLDGIVLDIDDTAQISTSQITTIQNGGLTARRATPDVSGVVDLTNSSASALDGAVLRFENLTQYSADRFGTPALVADGLGSTLDLSAVTSFSGNSNFRGLNVSARQGGQIMLPNVGSNLVGGWATFEANGVGSFVDLTPVSSIQLSGSLRAFNGGVVKIPGLVQLDGLSLELDDTGILANADGSDVTNQVTAQLSAVSDGGLRMIRNDYDFSGISTFSNSNAIAEEGAVLSLPGVTTYTPNFSSDRFIRANGLGSRADLSNVQSLSGNRFGSRNLFIQAQNGGRVEMADAGPAIVGGRITIDANGLGSVVDLSSVSGIQATGTLRATNGGTVRMPDLTQLDGMQIEVDDTGDLETSQIANIVNGGITVRRTQPDFSSLRNLRDSSVRALEGSSISLPQVTRFTPNTFTNLTLSAEGLGASLDMSEVSTFTGNAASNRNLAVVARGGGSIDLSNVSTILFGRATYSSDGLGSVLNLSQATEVRSTGSLQVSNGGIIRLHETKPVAVDNTEIVIAGGQIRASEIRLEGNASLRGDGAVNASVLNRGRLGDNNSFRPISTLEIQGDLTQETQGETSVRIRERNDRGVGFDAFDVTGSASLAGRFSVSLVSGFVPDFGDTFDVIKADQINGAFERGGLVLDGGKVMTPVVIDDEVIVVTALAGDVNLDGKTDLMDFTRLKERFGSPGRLTNGDVDGSGTITLEDFTLLKENFGRDVGVVLPGGMQPAAVAVPEPSTWLISALAGCLILVFRQNSVGPFDLIAHWKRERRQRDRK